MHHPLCGDVTDSSRQRQPGHFLPSEFIDQTHTALIWHIINTCFGISSSVNSRIEVFEVRGCASFISVSLVFRVGLARKRWLVSVFWMNDSMCPSYVPRRNVLHAHWPYSLQNICMPPEDPHTHLLSKEFPKCLHQNEAVLLKNKINITRGKVDNGCLSVVGFQREPEHVFSLPGMPTPTPAPPPHTAQFTCKNPSYLKLICISSENLPWFSPLPD